MIVFTEDLVDYKHLADAFREAGAPTGTYLICTELRSVERSLVEGKSQILVLSDSVRSQGWEVIADIARSLNPNVRVISFIKAVVLGGNVTECFMRNPGPDEVTSIVGELRELVASEAETV